MAPHRTVKPVAAVTSGKAQPDLLSFLDLPSEIRNQIYATFFESSTAIRLRWNYGRIRDGVTELSMNFQDRSISRRFLDGKMLLPVCRQVYLEATTMFFASNTWTIYHEWFTPKSVVQLQRTAFFLRVLGSRSKMLKKLVIDLGGTCSPSCPQHDRHSDIPHDPYLDISSAVHFKDLVKMLHGISSTGSLVEVTLTFTIPASAHGCRATTLAYSGLELSRLNNVLRTLVQDPLNFLKYGNQVYEVTVARNGVIGCVVFGHSLSKWSHEQYFRISDNGQSIFLLPSSISDSIMLLPPTIKSRIFEFVTGGPCRDWYSENVATFDLDRRTCTGMSPILGSVCQELRQKYLSRFWTRNRCTIKMTSTIDRTDFDGFRKLEKFWCVSDSARYPWSTGDRDIRGATEFLLHFDLGPTTTLQNLRVNITDFLRITSSLNDYPAMLTISIAGEKDDTCATTTVAFVDLRWHILIALSEFLRRYPNAERKLCPKVWINGLGQVLEVEGMKTVVNTEKHIRKYTPRVDHWETFEEDYEIEPIEVERSRVDQKLHIPSRPVEAFDGSLYFYLGYLQSYRLQNGAKFRSDYFFQFPDLAEGSTLRWN